MSYTYKDKYGISHTVNSESTAKQYAVGGYSGSGTKASSSSSTPSSSSFNYTYSNPSRAGQSYSNEDRNLYDAIESQKAKQKNTQNQAKTNDMYVTRTASNEQNQQYSFPYESLLKNLMNQTSTYKAPTESELLSQARQYAQLQVDPVLSAIQSSLANAQTTYDNAKTATEAAYAGVPARTQSLLDEARKSALESAISRGMGRSGVVDWQTEKLSEPIMQEATQSEAEKAAKLAAIANTLATTQSEAERQRQEAQSRLGTLESSRLAELRQQAQDLAAQEQASKWGQGLNLAQLAQQANASEYNNAIYLALQGLLGGA